MSAEYDNNQEKEDLIRATDFFSGALPPVGIYGFDVKRVTVQEGDYGKFLLAQLDIISVVKSTEEKEPKVFDRPLRPKSDRFPLSGRGVEKTQSFYRAVTGTFPSGRIGEDGQYYLDPAAMADDLLGGTGYGVYIHKQSKKEGDPRIFGQWGYSFSKDAEGIYPPKGLREEK